MSHLFSSGATRRVPKNKDMTGGPQRDRGRGTVIQERLYTNATNCLIAN